MAETTARHHEEVDRKVQSGEAAGMKVSLITVVILDIACLHIRSVKVRMVFYRFFYILV